MLLERRSAWGRRTTTPRCNRRSSPARLPRRSASAFAVSHGTTSTSSPKYIATIDPATSFAEDLRGNKVQVGRRSGYGALSVARALAMQAVGHSIGVRGAASCRRSLAEAAGSDRTPPSRARRDDTPLSTLGGLGHFSAPASLRSVHAHAFSCRQSTTTGPPCLRGPPSDAY
jgi:hypothetical protein